MFTRDAMDLKTLMQHDRPRVVIKGHRRGRVVGPVVWVEREHPVPGYEPGRPMPMVPVELDEPVWTLDKLTVVSVMLAHVGSIELEGSGGSDS